jgi:AraC-like DNA-binding protein
MKIISLPDELLPNQMSPVKVVDYRSSKNNEKQQIVLNQNTFSFLLEGKKEVIFDNSFLSIDSSQFLLMRSGHCLMTEKLSLSKQYQSILLFFSNEVLINFSKKIKLERTKTAIHKSVHSFAYDDFIKKYVSSLSALEKGSKKYTAALLEIKLEEILLYLLEWYGSDFITSLLSASSNATQKFTHTVESNQLNRLTLSELAFLCNMSVSTFKREFERHYSDSPMKWFQNKRLEHAHHLIHYTHKKSSEVYLEAGYENLSSFLHAYKLKYGNTPRQH